MIHSQETDLCGADNGKCKIDDRKSPENFRGDSPKLKKARHSWQVKNKPLAVVDDRIHSQPTITINGARQHEGLQENELCSDSIKPCCSYSALNDRNTHTTYGKSSHNERNDIAESKCNLHLLCLDGHNHCETAILDCASDDQNPTNSALDSNINTTNGALDEARPNDDDDSCNLDFSYALEDSAKSDSSVIILVPQFSDIKKHSCNTDSTDYPSAQNLATRSIDPNDPVRYIAMPTGKWLLECSLMRAELDNDINKALERLRYYADQSAQWTQRAYISKRISLESAGIFQVIEEQGLRTTSSISPPHSSTLRPYCKGHTLAVENLASSSTSRHNDTYTKSLHNYIVESTEENGLDVTMMSDLCSTRNEPASPNASFACSLQSNSPELSRSSDLTKINELSATPSSSFIIDQAVSAVIVERGIHL